MTDEKKEALQPTIDLLLYCDEYKHKLMEFNKQFINCEMNSKFSHNIKEFLFPLEKAI